MVYKLLLKHDPRGILAFFALRVGHNKHVENTQVSNANYKNYSNYLSKVLKVYILGLFITQYELWFKLPIIHYKLMYFIDL